MNIFDVLYARQTGKTRPRAKITDNLLGLALAGGGYEEKTIDFTPVISVSDAKAGNALDYQCKITATQSGSGDPTPSNIRPITGWTGANISVNGSTVSVSWQSEAGTVYGGVRNLTTGELTVTHAMVDLALLEWETRWEGDTNKVIRADLSKEYTQVATNAKIGLIAEQYLEIKASTITGISNNSSTVGIYTYRTVTSGTTNYIFAVVPIDETPSGKMVYPVAETTEYTLTPTEIALVAGANTLWSDTGDSAMTYLAKK